MQGRAGACREEISFFLCWVKNQINPRQISRRKGANLIIGEWRLQGCGFCDAPWGKGKCVRVQKERREEQETVSAVYHCCQDCLFPKSVALGLNPSSKGFPPFLHVGS